MRQSHSTAPSGAVRFRPAQRAFTCWGRISSTKSALNCAHRRPREAVSAEVGFISRPLQRGIHAPCPRSANDTPQIISAIKLGWAICSGANAPTTRFVRYHLEFGKLTSANTAPCAMDNFCPPPIRGARARNPRSAQARRGIAPRSRAALVVATRGRRARSRALPANRASDRCWSRDGKLRDRVGTGASRIAIPRSRCGPSRAIRQGPDLARCRAQAHSAADLLPSAVEAPCPMSRAHLHDVTPPSCAATFGLGLEHQRGEGRQPYAPTGAAATSSRILRGRADGVLAANRLAP